MLEKIFIPENYKPILNVKETEIAIKMIKDFFEQNLATELRLRRVTAPMFVQAGKGINDDLDGKQMPVSFVLKNTNLKAEVVQSLAKWKRIYLADYDIGKGYGIYTDMNAIRPDEICDNLHSIYVDQWDWEMVISKEMKNLEFLKKVVKKIYSVIKRTEYFVYYNFPRIEPELPEEIKFIHSEELLKEFPNLKPNEREYFATKKYGAIFLIGIGMVLSDGIPHDNRAPDYDDWSTKNEDGYYGLNGDIIVWHPVLKNNFEISSMGIRVDKKSLLLQLKIKNCLERKKLYFHKRLINNELPLSIGGGIGQSRMCMLFLKKAHIGEVQSSIWSDKIKEICKKNNIFLL